MKKVLGTILIFAAVLAVLVTVAALVERSRPAEEPEEAAEAAESVITNEMDELKSTRVRFSDGRASIVGAGAQYAGGVLTIGYPGTYRLEGELADGQVLVDLGDFRGAVYLILDGVSVRSADGPALYVRQADLTVLHLSEGTENSFADGAGYLVIEGKSQDAGAGVFSADDLVVEGGGVLTVRGNTADGLRSKDALTVRGGTLVVYAADDGIQASDSLVIEDGDITVGAYGDGLTTTKGDISVLGGQIAVQSAGDGFDAAGDIRVAAGTVSVTAYNGAGHYADIALADLSAKGMKAAGIEIGGGTLLFDTADDALHAGSVRLTDGALTIASGDDAVHADGALSIEGGALDISTCYEALEGAGVRVSGGTIRAEAEHKGVDAGEDGFVMTGGTVVLSAPRCVDSASVLRAEGGSLTLYADGTESVLCFASGVFGSTVTAFCAGTDTAALTERGAPDGSLLFVLPETAAAGTELTLSDESGTVLLTLTAERDTAAVLVASGALRAGQSYALAWLEQTLTGAAGEGCTVVAPAAPAQGPSSGMGGMGGPSGGPRPGW